MHAGAHACAEIVCVALRATHAPHARARGTSDDENAMASGTATNYNECSTGNVCSCGARGNNDMAGTGAREVNVEHMPTTASSRDETEI